MQMYGEPDAVHVPDRQPYEDGHPSIGSVLTPIVLGFNSNSDAYVHGAASKRTPTQLVGSISTGVGAGLAPAGS